MSNYQVNGKNLSVCRLMPKARYGSQEMTDKMRRLRYLHVGPQGTSVVTNMLVARVSLPEASKGHKHSHLVPADALAGVERPAPESTTLVDLPDGPPAVTGPQYVVPDIDKAFPSSDRQIAQFTCNADVLRTLLTIACDVSEDADKTVTLRICDTDGKKPWKGRTLRIDSYHQPEDQSFCALMKEIEYDGSYIAGEPVPTTSPVEKKPQQAGVVMQVNEGRRFRGEGE